MRVLLDADNFTFTTICSFLNQHSKLTLRSVCGSLKNMMERCWLEYEGLEFTQNEWNVAVPGYKESTHFRRYFKSLVLITQSSFLYTHLVHLPNLTSFKWYNAHSPNLQVIDQLLSFTSPTASFPPPSTTLSPLTMPHNSSQSSLKSFRLYISYYCNKQLIDSILTKLTFLEDLALHAHIQAADYKWMLGGINSFSKLKSFTLSLFNVHCAELFLDWLEHFPYRNNLTTLTLCLIQDGQGDDKFSLREFIQRVHKSAPHLQRLKILRSSKDNNDNLNSYEKGTLSFTYIQLPYKLSSKDEDTILKHVLDLDQQESSYYN